MPPPVILSRQSWSALAAHTLLLGGAGAAIFLAGGAEQGSMGVFLLCAGAALVACPPRARIGWPLWATATGLAGCAALAFLPARWVPAPLWRRLLAKAPAIALPTSITAAPSATACWLAVLVLSLVIGLFALTQPVRARWMIRLALAAVTTCAVYAVLAMAAKLTGWHYPLAGDATFGFLPNRNHTATLLITGGVLAAGLLNVALRDRRWILADAVIAGAAACLAALFFFSSSRAGVLILLAGVGLWVAGLGRRHRPGRLLVAAAVAGVVAAGLFLSFESLARDRLLDTVGLRSERKAAVMPTATPVPLRGLEAAGRAPADQPSEYRLAMYRDVLGMIRDQPWTGSGLGTFAGVFAPYRHASLNDMNAIHPESDWLMLAAEAGLPACGFSALLVALAAGRLRGQREHPYWPLRWGFAAAAAAALLHSMVDVPVHRAALGWWMLALAGLALQGEGRAEVRVAEGEGEAVRAGERSFNTEAQRAEEGHRERRERGGPSGGGWQGSVQHAVFVLAGVGALAFGGFLVRAQWFGGTTLPPFAADAAPRAMFDLYQQKKYAEGIALGRRTLREAPLTASAYYYLGVLITAVSDEEDADEQVDTLFQAERVLDPVTPDVARHQAAAWAGYDPVRETAMIMEELGRRVRIDQMMGRRSEDPRRYYGDLVRAAAAAPDLQRYLLAVARPDGTYEDAWARRADPGLVQSRVDRIAQDQAWVRENSGAGDGYGLLRPEWYAWPESAGPALPAAGVDGAQQWEVSAWPVRVRQCVYAGKYEEAVRMMAQRYGIALEETAEGNAGEAARAAQAGHWREAWLALEREVRHTRQMEWP